MLPPAAQIFEKRDLLENFDNFIYFVMTFNLGASRGAASGGSDFEKNVDNFLYLSVTFKQGASRGAASGGSDF